MRFRASLRVLLVLLLAIACAMPATAAELAGTWIRDAPVGEAREGMVLDHDGQLALVGIPTLAGLRWAEEAGTLEVTTLPGRSSAPEPSRLSIAASSAETLTLSGDFYLAGTWHRSDAAVDQVDGSVFYRERVMPPPDAIVQVEVRDVSRADAPSVFLGGETIPVGGRSPPYAFRVVYFANAVDPRFTYAVSAALSAGGRMIFRNTTMIPVITRGAPSSGVEVLMQKISRSAGRREDR
jgi:putative lipoprotein